MIFKQISILGLGLIGGSIALELKAKKLCQKVIGYNRSALSRKKAIQMGACDEVYSDPVESILDADLVILATPVQSMTLLAKQIAFRVKPKAIITDVGSTKVELLRQLNRIFPKNIELLGGHPIAGTEQTGMQAATLNLFRDKWWVLTPSSKNKKNSISRLSKLFRAMGAKLVQMSPREHDQTFACVSHLPQMSAYSLVHTANKFKKGHSLAFSGSGFKDSTRIACGSPEMWAEICLDNAQSILEMIERQKKSLQNIAELIQNRKKSPLTNFFKKMAELRRNL